MVRAQLFMLWFTKYGFSYSRLSDTFTYTHIRECELLLLTPCPRLQGSNDDIDIDLSFDTEHFTKEGEEECLEDWLMYVKKRGSDKYLEVDNLKNLQDFAQGFWDGGANAGFALGKQHSDLEALGDLLPRTIESVMALKHQLSIATTKFDCWIAITCFYRAMARRSVAMSIIEYAQHIWEAIPSFQSEESSNPFFSYLK